MTGDRSTFVTPTEACRRLEPFCPVTKRRLEDWRHRHALPGLVRRPLGPGCGPGWTSGWTDPEILVQVATLQSARNMHCRVDEWMKLAGWFAGFDYPPDEIRAAWRSWWRRGGVDAIGRHLGAPISDSQLPAATQAVYSGLPRKRQRPSTLALLRAELDPTFSGPNREALDDARRQWRDQTHLDLPEMLVRNGFELQQAFGSASLEAMVTDATAAELADAHRDARFLLTPLRLAAADVIDTGEGKLAALLFGLIVLGGQLHTASLVLRHAGHGERVDQTIGDLRVLCATPAVHDAFWATVALMCTYGGRTATDPGGATSSPSPEALSQVAEYWDNPELRSAFNTAWSAVRDTWADLAGPLVDALLDAFGADPSGEADHSADAG